MSEAHGNAKPHEVLIQVRYTCPSCGGPLNRMAAYPILPDGRIDMSHDPGAPDRPDEPCSKCSRHSVNAMRRAQRRRKRFADPRAGQPRLVK